MDFSYTDEQNGLRSALERLLTRDFPVEDRMSALPPAGSAEGTAREPWSEALWSKLAELGLTALPFSEELGGAGGSAVDVVAAGEVAGAKLVHEPWTSTHLAGAVLSHTAEAGSSEAADLISRIAEGEALAALAHEEGRGTASVSLVQTTAERTGDGAAISGEKRLVLAGAQADALVVTAMLDGTPAVLLVEGDARTSVSATEFTTVDGRAAAHLVFDRTPATVLAEGAEELLESALGEAILALSAEAVGAMVELVDVTRKYAHVREQFGRPIASFQAIAHRMADMKIACTKARAMLLHTAALAEAGRMTPRDVSLLKAQVGRAGREVGEGAIQVHGGVGMTDELVVGHLYKRILVVDAMLGDAHYHVRRIGSGTV